MRRNILLSIAFLLIIGFTGCNSAEETKKIPAFKETEPQTASALPAVNPAAATAPAAKVPRPDDVIAEVDGSRMTRAQLDAELKKKMAAMAGKLPPEQLVQATASVRKQIVDDFIMRTLLLNELNRLKIRADDREINAAIEDMKGAMPAGATLEDIMKKGGISREQLRKEISLGIRINKLIESQKEVKSPPTEKEIQTFYKNNKDKFKIPEAVHVRHILVASKTGTDDKTRTGQHQKAEGLRQQLISGKDFAELAKANSDCPSKNQGGDLGTFTRGQMVKPFENAAFKQKVNEIGPIVETEFGFHIIQVLEHHQAKTQPLDQDTKNQISGFLREKKKYEVFNRLVAQLKAKAHIVVTDIS